MNILIINGPNLNFLGIREIGIYGQKTYQDLIDYLNDYGKKNNINLVIEQTNYEGKIIDLIQNAYYDRLDGIILNAGALTHYSYAILDAIKSIDIPTVEVHLSDIYSREDFRKVSIIKPACIKSFHGEGFMSYIKAIDFLKEERNK